MIKFHNKIIVIILLKEISFKAVFSVCVQLHKILISIWHRGWHREIKHILLSKNIQRQKNFVCLIKVRHFKLVTYQNGSTIALQKA